MPEGTAFRTTDPAVLAALENYRQVCAEVTAARAALASEVGRNLYVARSGFGRSTSVVGFERLDTDKDGDLIGDNGALIVPSSKSKQSNIVKPNTRRKSGQEFAATLRRFDSPDIDIPGLPSFIMGSHETALGLAVHTPAIWTWGLVAYAYWQCPMEVGEGGMGERWEKIPLSAYYLAQEEHDAAQQTEPVSGNDDTNHGEN